MDDPAAACDGIGEGSNPGDHTQVLYCWAWNQYLCANCRIKRNDAELKHSAAGPMTTSELPLRL
jgi:hypothetical protein